MPDIYFDVDAALGEVPVNIFPLTDDTDMKTRETAVAYNAAGMGLVWNFVTSAGAFTQTAVTPTTAGTYDWTHQGDGMYTIEIPASAGASINNDTEGYGWFTGIATGVMPWRSPIFGFRAAAINDSLCDTNTTGLLAPTTAGRTLDVSAGGEAGVDWANVGSPTTTLNLSGTSTKALEPTTAGRTLDVTTTGEAGLDFANVNLPVGSIPIVNIIENGTMQTGSAAGTAVLRSATSFVDDLIIGATIIVTGGTGAGQSRIIYDWVSTTDTASVSPNWTTTPDNTSTYLVVPTPPASTNGATLPAVNLTSWNGTAVATPDTAGYPKVTIKDGTGAGEIALTAGVVDTVGAVTGAVGSVTGAVGSVTGAVGSVTGAVGSVTGNVGGNVTGSVGSVAAGGITAASIATGAFDADALATDAVTEIVTGVLTSAMTEAYPTDGSTMTVAQALYLIAQSIGEFSVSGTTVTVKRVDGTTTAATYTLDSSTAPTSRTRAT